ncbi:MAG: type II toxin-antitoxin system RelE/ParE family toxin [Coriobacteriales bacterium]|nr:type II toxin-antitoxin system RelE/ParE family toxin [Coriobacteriales bacterium]
MWKVRYSDSFIKQLAKFDKPIARRILDYMDSLQDLPDPRKRGKALSQNLRGYWRYRVGDYRVIAGIEDDACLVLAIDAGHRSEVYKRR